MTSSECESGFGNTIVKRDCDTSFWPYSCFYQLTAKQAIMFPNWVSLKFDQVITVGNLRIFYNYFPYFVLLLDSLCVPPSYPIPCLKESPLPFSLLSPSCSPISPFSPLLLPYLPVLSPFSLSLPSSGCHERL